MKFAGEMTRLGKHVSVYTLGNIFSRGGAFILLPLYTRFLLPSEYGMLELFYSLASMVTSFLSLGLAHATLRFYFEYDDPADRSAVVSTSIIASFAVSSAGVLLLSTANPLIQNYLFAGRTLGYSLSLVYAGLVLDMTSQIGLAYLRAREYSRIFVLSSLARLITQVCANLFTVVVLKKGVEGILIGNLLAIAAECSIVSFYSLKECGIRFRMEKLRTLVGYSYPFLLAGVVGVCLSNFDRFFLASMYSMDQVGVYALALKFGLLLSVFFLEPFQRGYGAFRFSIMKQENAPEIQSRILVYVVSSVTWVGLLIALFSPYVLRIIGTDAYSEAANIIPVIMLSISIASTGYIFQTGILYQKQTRYVLYVSSTTSVINLLCMFAGVKFGGMYGAVAANFVVTLCNVCMTNYFSQKVYPIQYPYRTIFLIYIFGAFLFGIGALSTFLPAWMSFTVRGGMVALFAYGLFATKVIREEESRFVLGHLRSTRQKLGTLFYSSE